MTDRRKQAVNGLIPPELDEAVIRVTWPSVAAFPGVAATGRLLMRTVVLAPLGWLLLAPVYFLKVLPGMSRRYVLTNRRVMSLHGKKPVHEVALADIEDVRIQPDGNTPFYRAANLEILSKGAVATTLRGVAGPEAFRQAILNACKAWVPGKAAAMERFHSAAAATAAAKSS
jgi:hypothetical protein